MLWICKMVKTCMFSGTLHYIHEKNIYIHIISHSGEQQGNVSTRLRF